MMALKIILWWNGRLNCPLAMPSTVSVSHHYRNCHHTNRRTHDDWFVMTINVRWHTLPSGVCVFFFGFHMNAIAKFLIFLFDYIIPSDEWFLRKRTSKLIVSGHENCHTINYCTRKMNSGDAWRDPWSRKAQTIVDVGMSFIFILHTKMTRSQLHHLSKYCRKWSSFCPNQIKNEVILSWVRSILWNMRVCQNNNKQCTRNVHSNSIIASIAYEPCRSGWLL